MDRPAFIEGAMPCAGGRFGPLRPALPRDPQAGDQRPARGPFRGTGTDHIMTVQSPELVLPPLRDFLREVEAQ